MTTNQINFDGQTIQINSFVLRQTSNSRFSHFNGNNKELLQLIKDGWENAKPGYRTGVLLVPVEPSGFFSGVVKLQEGDSLVGTFEARRDGEEPRKSVTVPRAEKLPAKRVDIVLYRSDVLAEGEDNELPVGKENWEVISINASPVVGEVPIEPNVLMHNHFGSSGGTRTNLSDEDFVAMLKDSFRYWSDKALAGCDCDPKIVVMTPTNINQSEEGDTK